MTYKHLNHHIMKAAGRIGTWLKVVAGIFGSFMVIWAAGYGAHEYLYKTFVPTAVHAKFEVEVVQEIVGTQLLYLRSRQGQLLELRYRLLETGARRPLTPLERERLREVERELSILNAKIESLEQRLAPK